MKRLYTSYYSRSGKRPEAVSISAKEPFFYKGKRMRSLAPSWELLRDIKGGTINAQEYTRRYGKELKQRHLTPGAVVDALPEGSILLCYEGPGKFCHRHIVAVWLNLSGEAEVFELEKDGSPRTTPTSVDDLVALLDADSEKEENGE